MIDEPGQFDLQNGNQQSAARPHPRSIAPEKLSAAAHAPFGSAAHGPRALSAGETEELVKLKEPERNIRMNPEGIINGRKRSDRF